MSRFCLCALSGALLVLSGGLAGQDPKKEDPKAVKKDDTKKDDTKVKGMLPPNWGKLGLSDEQKQNIYKIQNKYSAEIQKLQEQIDELNATKTKEMRAVLTADQKKKLEEILLGKDKDK